MPIFLDTGNLREIERFYRMGVIRGVTTNPTILFKEGVIGGMRGIEERSRLIAKLIAPHPLSVEVTAAEREAVLRQAREFSSWGDNIVEWLEAGAHIVTAVPNLLEGMLVHPYTKETVKMFLQDGAKLEAKLKA